MGGRDLWSRSGPALVGEARPSPSRPCSHLSLPVTITGKAPCPSSGWSSSPQVTISHPWLALSLLPAVPLLEGVTRKSGALLPPTPGSFLQS